jgi:hypothetical protein
VKISRIQIAGLKGADPIDLAIDGPTAFVGPNGSGKSRVLDAVAFALGRPVAGVAGNGPDLLAAVAGDECRVTLTINDDGRVRTLTRVRTVDAKSGAFSRPRVFIDDAPADEADVVEAFGHVSVPGGDAWLAMSRDKLIAMLGSIGAATDDGKMAVATVRSKVVAVVGELGNGLDTDDADPVAWIAAARDRVGAAVNEAKRSARVADESAEISRKAAADAGNVSPDRLRNLEATRDEAQRQLDAAVKTHAERAAAWRGLTEQHSAWTAREAWLIDRIATLRSRLQATTQRRDDAQRSMDAARATTHRTAEHTGVDMEQWSSEMGEASEALRLADVDMADATARWQAAREKLADRETSVSIARAKAKDARDVADILSGGCCPTCKRDVTPDALADFTTTVLAAAVAGVDACEAFADQARAEVGAAAGALADVQQYVTALREQIETCRGEIDRLTRESGEAERAANVRETFFAQVAEYADSIADIERDLQATERDLAELRQSPPKSTSDARADLAAADESVAMNRSALALVQQALDGAQQAAAKHTRHRDDLARRDAAKKRKDDCDAAFAAVRAVEESLSMHGLKRIALDVDQFLPRAFGRIDLVDGDIGLRLPDGRFIAGAGLSGAQRVALTTGIDRALEATRKLRVILLEGDALSSKALRELAESAVASYWSESVGTVLIATCHDPGHVEGLTVVYTGDDQPPQPTGTDPGAAPTMVVNATSDAVGSFGSDPFAAMGYVLVDDAPMHAILDVAPLATPQSVTDVHVAVSPEAVDDVVADNAPAIHADAPPALDLHPQPAATAQPDLFSGVKLPDFLSKPGRTMLARKPDPEHVAKVSAYLSGDAARYLHDWPGNGAEPAKGRPHAVDMAVVHELIDAEILTDDPMDCRLTYGGVEVWRLMHQVEPVRSDAQALREDAPAPTGAGATEDDIAGLLKAAKLGAEALRFLGVTRAGLDTGTRRSASIWKRHIARALCQRGADADAVGRWIADAAEKHPKKHRAGADGGDDDEADQG